MKIIYAGDRQISVDILDFLHKNGVQVSALFVSKGKTATHDEELIRRCRYLSPNFVVKGKKFREAEGLNLISEINPDYIICVHFPYIVSREVLSLPKIGVINLHPALLPFNKGWHTPSWAILDNTPYGATLHFMDEGVDTGDILHQKEVKISVDDTAHTLYQKVLKVEYDVFTEYWPKIITNKINRQKQNKTAGTAHKPADLLTKEIQQISLNSTILAKDLLNKLRALTTNNTNEAAYFIHDGKKYSVQVRIREEK